MASLSIEVEHYNMLMRLTGRNIWFPKNKTKPPYRYALQGKAYLYGAEHTILYEEFTDGYYSSLC